MSSYMGDISGIVGGTGNITTDKKESKKSGYDLSMQDFLTLMMVELQNQTIDDTADTGEMLNQMVQMQMVTALTNMTDASVMSYSNSLVGKDVTIGINDNGKLEEQIITVRGTGFSGGSPVIFGSDGKTYYLSQIMAVGRLPEVDGATILDFTEGSGNAKPLPPATKPDDSDTDDKVDNDDKVDTDDKTDTDNSTNTEKPGGTDAPEEGKEPDSSNPEVPDDRPTTNPGETEGNESEDKADDSVQPPAAVG